MLATAILGVALIALGVAVGRCLRGVSAADHLQMALDVARRCRMEWQVNAAMESEARSGVEEGEKSVQGRRFAWRHEIEPSEDVDQFVSRLTIRWKEGTLNRQREFVELVPVKSPFKLK
jgi:ABC-type anion transport system duplicated permease subunit